MGYQLIFIYGKICLQFDEENDIKNENTESIFAINKLYFNYLNFFRINSKFNISNLSLTYDEYLDFIKNSTIKIDKNSDLSKIIYRDSMNILNEIFEYQEIKTKKISENELYIGYLIDNTIEIEFLLNSIYSVAFKIFFPKIFPKKNILHLDVDTMVVGNLNTINFKHNKPITVIKNRYLSTKYWFNI